MPGDRVSLVVELAHRRRTERLVGLQDGNIETVFAFAIAGGRIKRIWAIRNPEKLRPWTES